MSPNLLLYGVAPVSVSLSLKQQEDSSQQDYFTDWCFEAFWIDSSSSSVRNRGEDHHFPRQQRRSGICHQDEFRKSVRAAEIYAVSNFFFFKFSCSFCAKVNNFSEAGKQGWNNHKSQADKYCGKQICFQVPFFFCWSYKLHVTNARMLQCRWAHVNKMPTFISPSVDPKQASPEANSPPKVDASTWPEESHPKICD